MLPRAAAATEPPAWRRPQFKKGDVRQLLAVGSSLIAPSVPFEYQVNGYSLLTDAVGPADALTGNYGA